jgi:hypothetical protein
MSSKSLSLIFALTIVASCTPALAQQNDGAAKTGPIQQQLISYSPELAMVELASEYDLWIEATLKRKLDQAHNHEKNLFALVSHDILMSQDRVRQLAREVAFRSTEGDEPEHQVSHAAAEVDFKSEIASLNSKEAVYRALVKAKAFSNKYRLMGDYLDLIGQNLGEPTNSRAEADPVEPIVTK